MGKIKQKKHPPILDECNHLRVSFPQNALPIHLHQSVTWGMHKHIKKKGKIKLVHTYMAPVNLLQRAFNMFLMNTNTTIQNMHSTYAAFLYAITHWYHRLCRVQWHAKEIFSKGMGIEMLTIQFDVSITVLMEAVQQAKELMKMVETRYRNLDRKKKIERKKEN